MVPFKTIGLHAIRARSARSAHILFGAFSFWRVCQRDRLQKSDNLTNGADANVSIQIQILYRRSRIML